MALDINGQILEAINRSKNTLIVFKKNYSLDSVASAIAISLVMKKINKNVDIAATDFERPENWGFLPKEKIISQVTDLGQFIISLNIKNTGIDHFSYDVEGDKLNIFITPKRGTISKDDMRMSSSKYKYDLIITVDTRDLEALGRLYADNVEFFQHTPIVNIDHNPTNENFGQINLVDTTAISTTEIIYQIFESSDQTFFNKEISQCLLAGMISDTKSFKSGQVTPQSLQTAKSLIELGADRQQIVQELYRKQTIPVLKLWGRILARLKSENGERIVWSLITENDFLESGATPKHLLGITEELISSLPNAEIVVLLYQEKGNINVRLEVLKTHNALALAKAFSPQGDSVVAEFSITDKNLMDVENDVIEKIKQAAAKSAQDA